MSKLVEVLADMIGRTVVDKTGVSGTFNFQLDFSPTMPPLPLNPRRPRLPVRKGRFLRRTCKPRQYSLPYRNSLGSGSRQSKARLKCW